MGCFVSQVTERLWGCSRRRTIGFCSVSSSLYWNSPPHGLRRAPPGACAKDALDTTSSRVMLLHRGLSGLPFPLGLEQPLLPGGFSSSAPGMLASSSSWTLDKARGDLFTQPWGKKTNFCYPCLVSPTGRVSEFRRDLRASHPGTWADALCPETPP